MPLSVSQSATAIRNRVTASFLGKGGDAPYLYSVVAGGAGGSINPTTGVYTAPLAVPSDPRYRFDTIRVDDYSGDSATAQIMVADPLLLLCEIIQRCLGLASGRVYIWDQKINQPTDSGLYVAVSMPNCKPFANVNRATASGANLNASQYVCMLARVDLDIISRGPEARTRKEEVILALNSTYSEQQQERNSFFIGKLPPDGGFVNLSDIDGAAIPYRYKISVNMQYASELTAPIDYMDDFSEAEVFTEPHIPVLEP